MEANICRYYIWMKVPWEYETKQYGTTACKWDTIIPFEPLWKQYKRIIKSNGAIVLTAIQPFTSMLVMSNLRWFRYEWIWKKSLGANPLG